MLEQLSGNNDNDHDTIDAGGKHCNCHYTATSPSNAISHFSHQTRHKLGQSLTVSGEDGTVVEFALLHCPAYWQIYCNIGDHHIMLPLGSTGMSLTESVIKILKF